MKPTETLPASHVERLESVVMLAWKILKSRFLDGRHRIPTEAPFQHYFAHIISTIGETFCTSREDKFVVDLEDRIEGIRGRSKFIDIVCGFQNTQTYCAIELKLKTASQGAQDFGRIDSYLDIEAVELALQAKGFSFGLFFIITNSTAYINPSKVGVGTVFPMHEGARISPGLYSAANIKCKGREWANITLLGHYHFTWERSDGWYFLCMPIKKEPNEAHLSPDCCAARASSSSSGRS